MNDNLFGMACAGDITGLRKYYENGGEHYKGSPSLIMGAFNNSEFDTVAFLLDMGEKLTAKEKAYIMHEYRKQKTIENMAFMDRR